MSLSSTPRRASIADHQIPFLAPVAFDARPALDPIDVMTAMGEVVYDWNIETDRLSWGANAASIFGAMSGSVPASGTAFANCLDRGGQSRFDAVFDSPGQDRGEGVPFSGRYALQRDEIAGPPCVIEDRGRWFAGEDGRPRRAQGVMRVSSDIATRAQRPEIDIESEARHPVAVPVLSRQALLARIGTTYQEAPSGAPQLVLLLVSITDIAALRRSCGSAVAEEIVAATAARLRAVVRRTDSVLRWPEYGCALLLRQCGAVEGAVVARRLLDAMAHGPVETSVGRLEIGVSIGAAASAETAGDAATLLRGAEDALDQTFDKPDRRFANFIAGSGLCGASEQTRSVTRTLVASLDQSRVRLALQPIVEAGSRAVFCYEALARVDTGQGGTLAPDQVFPVAERSGLVKRIDRTMLELAVAHLRQHATQTVTVNVSPSSAHDPDWKNFATHTVAENPEIAARLIVEITEQAALGDVAATRALIAGLKRHGVRVAMDDFGAGHTSFRNLRDLDFDIVKIDGTFVRDLARSADDGYFVRTLLDLARHLGIKTVAEWVEDERTAALLTEWGADYLQGYLFGKAV